ncbi:hypothetical protein IJI94_02825 [Candidatus Saccharibacteria bacterium]|nr:hypothetical protein [Candidatus Saccharibacteria bacterium]
MVCIAAFIILCIISVFVAILSIFRRDIGRKYWKTFKKAWGCVWKKVRLQKCETNFKEDVKNSILKKVVIKKPRLVKPLSIAIEVASVLIVFITIWSLVAAVKAGLSLWTLGTCNVTSPSSCALGAEACSTEEKDLSWFEEWGEIFGAIPDRLKTWNAEEYTVEPKVYVDEYKEENPLALDIIDPGCSACMNSYRNQLESGFFDENNTILIVYPIEAEDGYKFVNSGLIARYFYATALVEPELAVKIIDRIFTERNEEKVNYQSVFNNELEINEAERLIKDWIKEFGLEGEKYEKVKSLAYSSEVDEILAKIKDIVENKVHVKGIPTMLYSGKKHYGLYKK